LTSEKSAPKTATYVEKLMHITRKKTRQIQAGSVKIGGDAPISVQSMCSTDTRDVKATVEQIRQLEDRRVRAHSRRRP
jgi:GTP cyclohydrolase III